MVHGEGSSLRPTGTSDWRRRLVAATAMALMSGGIAWCVVRVLLVGEKPATERYEDLNRAWSVVLFVLALGFLGMWRSFSVMGSHPLNLGVLVATVGLLGAAAGSAIEFWAGSESGFQLFALGLVVLATGTIASGLAAVRSGVLPRSLSLFLASSGALAFIGSIAGIPTLPFGLAFGLGCAAVGLWLLAVGPMSLARR